MLLVRTEYQENKSDKSYIGVNHTGANGMDSRSQTRESKLKLFTDAVKPLVEEASLITALKGAPFDSARDLLGR